MVDYKQLRVELFQAIRGDRSKYSLNQHFAFTYDKIGSWETEATSVNWDEFVDYALILDIPLAKIFHSYIHYEGDIRNGKELLTYITKGKSPDEIEALSNIPIARIRRLKNSFAPKVEEIFQLFDHFYSREYFFALIKSIAGKDLPTFSHEAIRCRKFIELLKTDPVYLYSAAVMLHGDVVSGAKNVFDVLSEQLALTIPRAQQIISDLEKTGVVIKKDNHYIIDPEFEYFGETVAEKYANASTYAQILSAFLSLPPDKDRTINLGYCTGMISKSALQEVKKELDMATATIMRIISEDKGSSLLAVECPESILNQSTKKTCIIFC